MPEDDPRRDGGANVGLLNKAMYGTRDAPAAWPRLVRQMFSELGFVPRRTSACVFVHPEKRIKVVSLVDDFLCAGPRTNLVWLREQPKAKYKADGERLGLL